MRLLLLNGFWAHQQENFQKFSGIILVELMIESRKFYQKLHHTERLRTHMRWVAPKRKFWVCAATIYCASIQARMSQSLFPNGYVKQNTAFAKCQMKWMKWEEKKEENLRLETQMSPDRHTCWLHPKGGLGSLLSNIIMIKVNNSGINLYIYCDGGIHSLLLDHHKSGSKSQKKNTAGAEAQRGRAGEWSGEC